MRASRPLVLLALGILLAACPGPGPEPQPLPDAGLEPGADAAVLPGPDAGSCQNGVREPPETCDGEDCPAFCADGNACTTDVLSGSPKTCDAVCRFVEKQAPECESLDGCCPAGCAERGDADCSRVKPVVAVVLSKALHDQLAIRGRLDRYQEAHPLYEFREILLDPSADPIASMEDRGGLLKRNWLEVRNTLRDLRQQLPRLIGVWLIAESMPTIWREEVFFAIPSAYKASLYPLVALSGDWYADFDPRAGGFTEIAGVTRGKARGDSYSADLWGAALVPVPGWGDPQSQLAGFFDRNHELRRSPPAARKLLYADTFGFTSRLARRIDASAYFSSEDAIFLGPNSGPGLSGFSSHYVVIVHKQGVDYVPSGSSGSYVAQGQAQIDELDAWVARTWFPNQGEFRKIGDDKMYFFNLLLRDQSLPLESIRDTFAADLPPLACGAGDCTVHVKDTYFADSAGITLDGRWTVFPDQQAVFQTAYTTALQGGEVLYGYITTHGAPDHHYFGISSQLVHDANFSALVYELQACSTADTVATDLSIGASYLFFGNAQAVTGYAQPSNINCEDGDCFDYARFLLLEPGGLVVDALFDRDYSMHVYFGDPLLVMP